MKIDTQAQNGRVVVTLAEERLDAHNSGELKDRFLRLLEEGRRQLVVDLSALAFIDSSGLGALLSGYKNATQRGGTLVLCGPQPRVRAMFELTRLNRVFDIYPTVQEALASQSVS